MTQRSVATRLLGAIAAAIVCLIASPASSGAPVSRDAPCHAQPPSDFFELACKRTLTADQAVREWRVPGRLVHGVAYRFAIDGRQFLDGRERRRGACWVSFARLRTLRIQVRQCEATARWDKVFIRYRAATPTSFSIEWETW